jgi:CBS domain-containing protein
MSHDHDVGRTDYIVARTKLDESGSELTFNTAREVLDNTKVQDVTVALSRVVDVHSTDSVLVAFQRLTENKILSLPIFDERRNKYIGFLDIVDVVHHFLDTLTETEVDKGFSSFKNRFAKLQCKDIADLSGRNPYQPVDQETPLGAVISLISEWDVHRVPVIDGAGELVSLLSQSRITLYLADHLIKFDFAKKTVGELKLGLRDTVICVKDTDLTVAAFNAMRKNRVSGVGVVNASGLLIGVLSVTDLRSVGYDEHLFKRLYSTVAEFLKVAHRHNSHKPQSVITVSAENTVGDVFALFSKYSIHRLYVVDELKKAIGVISLGDVLKLFA